MCIGTKTMCGKTYYSQWMKKAGDSAGQGKNNEAGPRDADRLREKDGQFLPDLDGETQESVILHPALQGELILQFVQPDVFPP